MWCSTPFSLRFSKIQLNFRNKRNPQNGNNDHTQARVGDIKQWHDFLVCIKKIVSEDRIWSVSFGWEGWPQVRTWVGVMGVGIAGILMTQTLHLPPEYVSGATVQFQMTLCEALAFQWERKLMSWQTAFINSQVLSLSFQCSYTLARYLFVQQFFLHQLCGKLHDKGIHSFSNGFSTCSPFPRNGCLISNLVLMFRTCPKCC